MRDIVRPMQGSVMRYRLVSCLIVAASLSLHWNALRAAAPEISLKPLGTFEVSPEAAADGTPFGGISGLTYDPGSQTFYGISDARGDAPGTAFLRMNGPPRYYSFRIVRAADGAFGLADVQAKLLPDASGGTYEGQPGKVDPEAISLAADGSFYWSSEGSCPDYQPFIRQMSGDGRHVAEIATPTEYAYSPEHCGKDPLFPSTGRTGSVSNAVFEAATVSPCSDTLFVATEAPLLQDWAASAQAPAIVRMSALPLKGDTRVRQYAYVMPPIDVPGVGPKHFGLVELLALNETELLALERTWIPENKIFASVIRIVRVSIEGADNIAGLGNQPLDPATIEPMQRQVLAVLNGALEPNSRALLDNMEAMSWGPAFGGKWPSLVLASDNNFNPKRQKNLFMVFDAVGAAPGCAK